MANYNRVILVGNLTRDPEKRYTANGVPVTNFSLAVNRRYRQGESEREETLFIDIVTWQRLAETCAEYLGKGRPVLVEGRLVQRKWETEDGQRRSKIEVNADLVQFLGSRDEASGARGGSDPRGGSGPRGGSDPHGGSGPRGGSDEGPSDDDIPF